MMRECIYQKVVMPGQANSRGTLFGGALLAMMDEAAAIAAMRHSGTPVVTAHINSVDFKAPILVGEIASIHAKLISTGRTSMRLRVEAWGEDLRKRERRFCTSAEVVMVAVDEDRRPTPVPPLAPEVPEAS